MHSAPAPCSEPLKMTTLPSELIRQCARLLRQGFRELAALLRWTGRIEGTLDWGVSIDLTGSSSVEVGVGSRVHRGTIISLRQDENEPGILRVGDNTSIGRYNNFRSVGAPITIGDNYLIARFGSVIARGARLCAPLHADRRAANS